MTGETWPASMSPLISARAVPVTWAVTDLRVWPTSRKLVHGRRVQPVTAVEEAQAVLTRLPGDSARSARSLLRRVLDSKSTLGILVRPQEGRR